MGKNNTVAEVVKESSHVFTLEAEAPMPESKPEIPVKAPTKPMYMPIVKPKIILPVERPGITDTPKIEPIVKPDTKSKSDAKPMKLAKTGDQSEERFILLGVTLLTRNEQESYISVFFEIGLYKDFCFFV
ncbi:hypothetical protein [Listeria booriae]|uniref:hypothetical protein n=1 Tax=Listeria booriae TaxID=1552123 RepID=UPI001629E1B1|nr:hypothetical protein [Listeria booriae]MBC2306112.1 hypothetical protein [Listeria booriae]